MLIFTFFVVDHLLFGFLPQRDHLFCWFSKVCDAVFFAFVPLRTLPRFDFFDWFWMLNFSDSSWAKMFGSNVLFLMNFMIELLFFDHSVFSFCCKHSQKILDLCFLMLSFSTWFLFLSLNATFSFSLIAFFLNFFLVAVWSEKFRDLTRGSSTISSSASSLSSI